MSPPYISPEIQRRIDENGAEIARNMRRLREIVAEDRALKRKQRKKSQKRKTKP